MAKAIQCDVCKCLVPQRQAAGWRTLLVNYQGVVQGEVYKDESDPRADVCSRECAVVWFEQVMDHCFRPLERAVGE